jgi:hypothetical protein
LTKLKINPFCIGATPKTSSFKNLSLQDTKLAQKTREAKSLLSSLMVKVLMVAQMSVNGGVDGA